MFALLIHPPSPSPLLAFVIVCRFCSPWSSSGAGSVTFLRPPSRNDVLMSSGPRPSAWRQTQRNSLNWFEKTISNQIIQYDLLKSCSRSSHRSRPWPVFLWASYLKGYYANPVEILPNWVFDFIKLIYWAPDPGFIQFDGRCGYCCEMRVRVAEIKSTLSPQLFRRCQFFCWFISVRIVVKIMKCTFFISPVRVRQSVQIFIIICLPT